MKSMVLTLVIYQTFVITDIHKMFVRFALGASPPVSLDGKPPRHCVQRGCCSGPRTLAIVLGEIRTAGVDSVEHGLEFSGEYAA